MGPTESLGSFLQTSMPHIPYQYYNLTYFNIIAYVDAEDKFLEHEDVENKIFALNADLMVSKLTD